MARRPLCLVAVLAATALSPAPAFGHAAFVASTPDPGARLDDPPDALTLGFTEPLNRQLSTATVVGVADGRPVAATVRAPSARRLVVRTAKPLGRGAYRVQWHTVSTQDGHALEGSYSFGVRVAAAGGEHTVEQSPLARGGWLRVVLRGLLYAAALVLVAALLLPLLVPGTGRRWPVPDRLRGVIDVEPVRDRVARRTADVAALAVGAAVATTLAEAADAAGGVSPTRLADFLLANEAGIGRVLVVIALVAATLTWQRRRRLAAVLSILALGAIAASGHAASATPRLPSILNDWLHLLAVSVWLGGIALLVMAWGPTLRRADQAERLGVAREVLAPFGRVALPAFVLVVLTGMVSLVTELGRLDALWTTSYGRVLAVKVALVALVATLSAVHALHLRPRLLVANPHPSWRTERRHWRLVALEPVVGTGVIGAVALLVAFPLPPRQLGDATEEAMAAAPACRPCPLPRPAANELPVADGAGSQLVAAWIRRTPGDLRGTVRILDYKGRPSGMPFAIPGARQAACGRGCADFRLPSNAGAVVVTVRERGRVYRARLPARWRAEGSAAARRLVRRAQAVMRGLRSVRQVERVTSGPGSFAATTYLLRAPDRMAYRTTRAVESVVLGDRQWTRAPGTVWRRGRYAGGLRFRTRSWFRWTTYARAVRLLDVRRYGGGPWAELALMDEGTPVWIRLKVDLATGRVAGQRMVAPAHFATSRYERFNRAVRIAPPEGR
jgi:copper transport protein